MSLSGNVSEMPLSDLLQVSAHNRRTCVIAVFGAGLEGEIYFDQGTIVHARYGDFVGDQAVRAVLASPSLDFEVRKIKAAPDRTVTKGWQTLILEAAQFMDEDTLPRPEPRRARTDTLVARPPQEKQSKRSWLLVAITATALVGMVAWANLTGMFAPPEPETIAADLAASSAGSIAVATYEATELAGRDDEVPQLLSGKPPIMPRLGLSMSPTIVCRLLIDPLGRVAKSQIYRSRLELAALEELALQTVTGYRFSPGRKDGAPVATWINWPIGFSLPSDLEPAVLHIKGSDTIGGKLGTELAAAFMAQVPSVEVTVEALGSSTAFMGLFDGTAHIGASSRSIKESELEQAAKLGMRLNEYVIGYDGIAIIVHPDNPLNAITIDQASRVFSGALANWRELGGPDAPIRTISRPSYSGTHALFKTKILRRSDEQGPEEFAPRTEYIESSEEITRLVASDPASIAYIGLGWVSPEVTALDVSPGPGLEAIAPDLESVRQGLYPIYRPLMMYTNGTPTVPVQHFLRFVLGEEGQQLVKANGFVPSDTAAAAIDALSGESGHGGEGAPIVKRIWFPGGGMGLDAAAKAELNDIARQLEEQRQRLIIVGHADALGDAASNASLAEHRALGVAAYFRKAGVDAARIEINTGGENAPISSNQTAAGRAENRRVDIFLIHL